MPCACCWSVGNHIILKRDSGIQVFLNGDILLNGSWLGWNFEMEGGRTAVVQKDGSISEAWRSGQKTLDMWANCVLKHCFSLKTIIPNLVAFFVSLGIVISCVRKMSFSVTSEKQDGTLIWSRGRTIVAPGEKHQQNLAIRTEDTGHVSNLCVKTLFFSGNFHS